ncbi:MAG: sigma-70 family RNA polymerase sigma factor [Candidatus Zixiibacteriota bacterium]|nr:MAG: sigma-70 family RNA polymerase sigma factor [candidate division Zixibacteria bacterium]
MSAELQDLVARFIEGDRKAFAELVRRYKKRIYSIAYRMLGNHLDADEVTQEAFVRIYRKRGDIKSASFFSSLLLRIATNYAIDLIRKKQKGYVFIDSDTVAAASIQLQLVDKKMSPDRMLENEELMDEIRRAIEKLPPRQRAAIVLHDVEGYSKSEVAAIMGCPQATVRSNLHIARSKLKKWLRKIL